MVLLSALMNPCSSIVVADGELLKSCGDLRFKDGFEELAENYGSSDVVTNLDETDEPLLSLKSFIRHLGSVGTVEAEAVPRQRNGPFSGSSFGFGEEWRTNAAGQREFETHAMQPCTVEVMLPENHVPGQRVRVKGPKGWISIHPPDFAAPGSMQKIRLAPQPEFKIEVPPGTYGGADLKFDRDDGTNLAVTVPKGMRPGDVFEVMPPALMVHVPKAARPGDLVVFPGGAAGAAMAGIPATAAPLWRAKVPKGLVGEEYFAVRIPAGPKILSSI